MQLVVLLFIPKTISHMWYAMTFQKYWQEAESLWLEVILNDKKTVISVIYRHPAPQCDSFTKELVNILHNLNDNKVTNCICGDFNINLLQHESSQQVKNYTNLMLAYNCTQPITRPTRITDHSATLLDHIYTNNIKMPVQPGIILSDLSEIGRASCRERV